jgi:hypothetical protein
VGGDLIVGGVAITRFGEEGVFGDVVGRDFRAATSCLRVEAWGFIGDVESELIGPCFLFGGVAKTAPFVEAFSAIAAISNFVSVAPPSIMTTVDSSSGFSGAARRVSSGLPTSLIDSLTVVLVLSMVGFRDCRIAVSIDLKLFGSCATNESAFFLMH